MGRTRAAVERELPDEERVLCETIRHLRDEVSFADWPAELLTALRAALTEPEHAVEAQKARDLRRHLFRAAPAPLGPLDTDQLAPAKRRLAERLRADLAGCVPLGAGSRCSGI